MEDKVPDYFEDPLEKRVDEASIEIKKLLAKYQKDHNDGTFWSAYWMSEYNLAQDHPEERPPKFKDMILFMVYLTTFHQMQAVGELREIKALFQKFLEGKNG